MYISNTVRNAKATVVTSKSNRKHLTLEYRAHSINATENIDYIKKLIIYQG